MRKDQEKRNEAIIRIFSLFERELKNYHPVFQNNSYMLNYFVSRTIKPNVLNISVIMTILRSTAWRKGISEPSDVKKELESFSRYFSVDRVMVVRPGLAKEKIEENEMSPNQTTPISQRVFFEMFTR